MNSIEKQVDLYLKNYNYSDLFSFLEKTYYSSPNPNITFHDFFLFYTDSKTFDLYLNSEHSLSDFRRQIFDINPFLNFDQSNLDKIEGSLTNLMIQLDNTKQSPNRKKYLLKIQYILKIVDLIKDYHKQDFNKI